MHVSANEDVAAVHDAFVVAQHDESGMRTWLAWSRRFLVAAAALVPLASGYVPFLGLRGVFTGSTVVPVQSAALGVLIGLSLACWAVSLGRHETELMRVPYTKILTGLLLIVFLSTTTALVKRAAIFGDDFAEQGLLTYVGYFGAFLLVTQVIRDRREFLIMARAIAGSAAVVALFGVLQSAGLPYFPTPLAPYLNERGTSTLGNPNMLGTFLVLPMLVSMGFAVATRGRARLLWLVALSFTAASLLLTQTRGAWLGALAGVLVLGLSLYRSRVADRSLVRTLGVGAAWLAGLTACITVYQAATEGNPLFERIGAMLGGSNLDGGRFMVWAEALKVVHKYPLLGAGPDNMRFAWYGVTENAHVAKLGVDGVITDPHSYWLSVTTSSGILAGTLLVVFIGAVLWGSREVAFRRLPGEPVLERIVYSALWAGIVGLCIALTFSVVLTPIGLQLWLALGMLVLPRVRPAASRVAASRHGAAAVAAFVGLLLAMWGLATGLSTEREYVPSQSRLAKLQAVRSAQRVAPWRPHPVLIEARMLEAEGLSGSEIVPLIDRLIGLTPKGYEYYDLKAAHVADDPYRVIEVADAGLVVYPRGLRLLARRGVAEARLGQYDDALRDTAAAWTASRGAPLAYREPTVGVWYAQALLMAGKQREAATVLRDLQTEFPGNPSVVQLQSVFDAARRQ